MTIKISTERAEHINAITLLTEAAFQNEEHSSHTEQFIVNALRDSGQLTISLVAVDGASIVGHVAVSPVTISSGDTGWYGLGPISVSPERQGQGIGSQLMKAALKELQHLGTTGCVVLGNPAYYGRFGFKAHPGLILPGVPQEYFQATSFGSKIPCGDVKFHEAFNATE
ncbi:GNAT family N-acetyltransferase [Janthinobacterium sp. BJB426]|jgi:putative acetyltransferase|uniref:GNAT family N-acetyltransferase n=1 Tax=Janthinobacterium sp. BJB426 TaxID=2048010 RepID=UPI000C0FC022|nr:N-acetyltransferase [Janthinobacterium sp. BJB426]PHV25626.1 GNAT family N-acetyltransferase [Janthinobacterium sp. BJB426]